MLCEELPPLEGATTTYTSNVSMMGSEATYTYGDGQSPADGDAQQQCQIDGTWSGTAPTSCFSCASIADSFEYQGVCIAATGAANEDDTKHVPAGCQPYEPGLNWGMDDFEAIIDHLQGT